MGLTATPKQTFGFFDQNWVIEDAGASRDALSTKTARSVRIPEGRPANSQAKRVVFRTGK
jgi:hypothetical protein